MMSDIKEISSVTYGRIKITTTPDKKILYSLKDICKLFSINFQEIRTELASPMVHEVITTRQSKHVFVTEEALDVCLKSSEDQNADDIYDGLKTIKNRAEIIICNYTVDDLKDEATAFKVLSKLKELETTNSVYQAKIKEDVYKVELVDSMYGNKALIDLHMIHKRIKFKGLSLASILEDLRSVDVLDYNNHPYRKYIDNKYFRLVTVITHIHAEEVTRSKVLVYKKGIKLVEQILIKKAGRKQ